MLDENYVKILGCRGSIPVSGAAFSKYGGATTCFAVRLSGQLIVIDAGSGLLHLGALLRGETRIPMLLTHGHVDHVLGLPMCPEAFSPEMEFHLYTDQPLALSALMAPPLWPVTPEKLPARISVLALPERFDIGPVRVRTMSGNHPGGVKLLRLTGGGKSVTVMTDCTLPGQPSPALLDFAKDSDVLLIDGQFSPEEWAGREAFGHNTWTMAAEFGRDCGAKQVRIIHHDPGRTDLGMDAAAPLLAAYAGETRFGYEEETILL